MLRLGVGVLVLALESTAQAQPPTLEESTAPSWGAPFSLLATAEVELVDVEGPGGFANREPGLIKPNRRAPYVDLDKATLVLDMPVQRCVRANLELRAERDQTRVDRLFLDALAVETASWRLLLHGGRQKPMQRPPGRRVETYSPLGALFWRGREWHLGAHARALAAGVAFDAIASAAMQRDLGDESMGEDPGLPAIGFGHTELREGSAVEVGGLLGAGTRGVHLAGFVFRGRLLDNDGPDRLQRTFSDDYPALGDVTDRTSRWYGGRAWYEAHGAYALGEAIGQRLGLLHRRGFEIGGGYRFGLDLGGARREIEPFARYGQLTTTNLPERFLVPESWDREQWLAALLVRPIPSIEVKIEYLWLRERTGPSAEGLEGVRDDQLLVQVRLAQGLL